MAELFNVKQHKISPRIDLTPMVDLGFLLITFFVMTSNLNKSKTLDLQMPIEGGPPSEVRDFTAMTIFLGKNHTIYYLKGKDALNNSFKNLATTSFDGNGIRYALFNHIKQVKKDVLAGIKGSTSKDKPFIFIKPSKESNYADLINLIDELSITNIQDYAILDINDNEENAIKKVSL